MHPSEWEDRNHSDAEGLIFRKLRDETPDDWVAVHSVGLASHRTKPWAEIDFVVVGPFGVLCLEVKGGRITATDGRWETNGTPLKESPFSQAGGAAAALHRDLDGPFPALRRAVVGHGVVFPDVTFDERGPGIDCTLVYDDGDLTVPISKYLERIAEHWKEFHGRSGERFRPLSRRERTAIAAFLAPSFDLLPTLRARLARSEAQLIELTKTQARVLRGLRDQDRAYIRGGAGTGKTLLAVEEAERFASEGLRVLLCCRSPTLADYIAEHVQADLVDVRDYRRLLEDLVRAGDRERALPDAAEEDLLTVFLPEQAYDAAVDLGRDGEYDVLILDEAQDLMVDTALDVLDVLLGGGLSEGRWRIFLDHKQNVFSAVDRQQFERVRTATTSQYQLVDNCRNTPQINEMTCMLAAVEPDETLAGDGPDVVVRFVLDRAEDVQGVEAVVGGWLRRGVPAEDIVVAATDAEVAERVRRGWARDAARLVTFGEPAAGAVRLTTAAEFKGLESAAVVVVGIRELHERESLRRMYVACSRARVLLGIVIDEGAREDFELRAVEHARRRSAT